MVDGAVAAGSRWRRGLFTISPTIVLQRDKYFRSMRLVGVREVARVGKYPWKEERR
jgi:hypothetical protein